VPEASGWGVELAASIDRAVHRIAADRDVINVAVTPIAGLGSHGSSPTIGVVVTVAWRHEDVPPS
jgi:hypothetical protein